ncbi:MAG: DUF417 family protein [Bacteroidetes bacterium]|nr:MAG: DUF417 family protein [Bacteroidota bacterium]
MKKYSVGESISIVAVSLTLLWIGIFKFAPKEAMAIKPLVENHFAMSWLYSVLSLQMVSNLIGIAEILVAVGLLFALRFQKVGKYAGIASMVIFITTLSFLFTTPKMWNWVDGIPITDFFILKDLAFLGISYMVWEKSTSVA